MKLIVAGILIMALSCKSGPSDDQMEKELSAKISATYPGVTADIEDGLVTLSGSCPDESCKNSSESAAKGIKGVKSVTNNIVVNAPPPPVVEVTADAPLQTQLKSLLSAYKTVNGKVQDGVITLTGEIKRSQLTTLMQSVNELQPKRVENQLVIK